MISDLRLVVVLCRNPECLDTETSGMSSPRPTAHEHRATACTVNASFTNMHALCMHCACMRTIFASISTSPPKSPIVQPASAVQHVKSQKGFVQRRPRSAFGRTYATPTSHTARSSCHRFISVECSFNRQATNRCRTVFLHEFCGGGVGSETES